MTETWLPVLGYDDAYEVSSLGKVRSIRARTNTYIGRRINTRPNRYGYVRVGLHHVGYRPFSMSVHAIVMSAFVGPRPLGCEINHKDGNKSNNALSNLEYVTPQQNHIHASQIGLKCHGAKHHFAKLSYQDAREIRALTLLGVPSSALARRFGVAKNTIRGVLCGNSWRSDLDAKVDLGALSAWMQSAADADLIYGAEVLLLEAKSRVALAEMREV